MAETNTKKIKHYSNKLIDITCACVYWSAVVSALYIGLVYHNVYKRTD